MNQTIKNRINQIKSGQVPEGYEKTSFGVFPVDWEKEKYLQDICTINPKTEKLAKEFIYIDLESVVDGRVINKNIIKRKNAPSRAQRVLEINDVIYQMVRPYQKNNYIYKSVFNMQTVASTGYAQLRGKVNEFIFQLVNSNYFCNQVLDKCTGTNYPAINSSDLAKVKIAYPKLQTEQAKIAEILMKWDEAIEAQQQLIQKLEIRKKALMQKLLTPKEGWVKKRINQLGEIKGSNVDKKINKNENMIKLLNYMDVYNHCIIDDDFNGYMNVSASNKQIENSSLKYGDILFTPSSETAEDIGHSAVYYSNNKCLYSYHLVRLRIEEDIDYLYRAYMFQAKYIRNQFYTKAVGPIRFIISPKQFGQCEIYIPIKEEQKRIANILSLADKEIELHKQQLKQLTKQRKSMMQLLLTGIVRTVTMDN